MDENRYSLSSEIGKKPCCVNQIKSVVRFVVRF
jgi:hypothetical protein